ncbi:MAG: hypothetical protein IJ284_01645 [Clostridia bacterium]|nr:hypothetical protein [Clostridia bacterium]
MMKRKTFTAVLLSLLLAFGVSTFTACEKIFGKKDSESSSSASSDTTLPEDPPEETNTYYKKNESLSVIFAGNSFIEFSASAYWLESICLANGATATVDYVWTPGGSIQDQYDDAFVDPAYMMEDEKPDVIFIQDFYSADDARNLGTFLEKLQEVSPDTEVKVFPAENETDDGINAAKTHDLEVVNWRETIKTLKTDYGFTDRNLNYLDDVKHANELSGVAGGVLAYMSLYGEIPDTPALWDDILNARGRQGNEVKSFLPGTLNVNKQTSLTTIVRVCAELQGLNPDEVCFHSYTYEDGVKTKCDEPVTQKATCSKCNFEKTVTLAPTGHTYEKGECSACHTKAAAEDGDLAHVNYLVPVPIEEMGGDGIIATPIHTQQSATLSLGSTSAMQTDFMAVGTDAIVGEEVSDDGIFASYALFDISDNDEPVSLENSTLSFDLKLQHCTQMIGVSFMNLQGMVNEHIFYFTSAYNSDGFAFRKLDNGWYRCEINCGVLENITSYDPFVGLLFTVVSDGQSEKCTFWLDNMHIVEDLSEATPDAGDLATTENVTTSIIADWNTLSEIVLQNKVVSRNSTSALRGKFGLSTADDWYDSSQDPNGDGGKWVWTVVTIDLTELYGNSVDLSDAYMYFDLKTVNCDTTSSLTLLYTDGNRPTQIPFDNDPESSYTSASIGYRKSVLNDGWVRMTASFDLVFPNDDLSEVEKVYLILSNAYGDYENDSVFYLDNLEFDDVKVNTVTPPEPEIDPDPNDLATLEYLSSEIVAQWMMQSDLVLQDEIVSKDSTSALRGSFNEDDADEWYDSPQAPNGDGGKWVWTSACLDFDILYGKNANLTGKALTFDVKVENGDETSSIILLSEDGTKSTQLPFNTNPENPGASGYAGYSKTVLTDGWVRITADFSILYAEENITDIDRLVIIFSCAYGDHENDTVFYLDNMKLENSTISWASPTVYNPNGYYNKDDEITVTFAGNSFIEFSQSAYWLQKICEANGASATINYVWTPNGTIADQHQDAFVDPAYMLQANRPDVIFIQDVYSLDDALNLGVFLTELYKHSTSTEVKVFPAENESTFGLVAAKQYGLDLLNWRQAIKTLKSDHGFTDSNLNYPDSVLHANELSGVVGGVLAYMNLYGEIPDVEALWNTVLDAYGREGDAVVDFLPGDMEADKKESLADILSLCAKMSGLTVKPEDICFHWYDWSVVTSASCATVGLQEGVCIYCEKTVTKEIAKYTHIFMNGLNGRECYNCGMLHPEDLSTTEYISTEIIDQWMVHSKLEVQSEVVSQDSTSALKGSFNEADADDWYDSSQDANGDGGKWVWTAVTLNLVELYNKPVTFSHLGFYFDVKVDNGDFTSSIILLDKNGNRSSQFSFNTDPNNSDAGITGFFKEVLDDGWVRITANFTMLLESEFFTSIDRMAILFSCANGDHENDTVFYLDNMHFSAEPSIA